MKSRFCAHIFFDVFVPFTVPLFVLHYTYASLDPRDTYDVTLGVKMLRILKIHGHK